MKIYVDIDETICQTIGSSDLPRDYSTAQPIMENIKACNEYYDNGHEITYWTARGTETGIDWSEVTRQQFDTWGVKYHKLMFGKPSYDLFIDDKVLNTKRWEENARCLPEA